jgi:hypothetical protein
MSLYDLKPLLDDCLGRAISIGKFKLYDLNAFIKDHLFIIGSFASADKNITVVVFQVLVTLRKVDSLTFTVCFMIESTGALVIKNFRPS